MDDTLAATSHFQQDGASIYYERFVVIGSCIGCQFILKAGGARRRRRIVAGIMMQLVARRSDISAGAAPTENKAH